MRASTQLFVPLEPGESLADGTEKRTLASVIAKLAGQHIATHRTKCGWKQSDIAAATGLTVITVSNIERGKSRSLANLYLVAGAMDLDVAAILPTRADIREDIAENGPLED